MSNHSPMANMPSVPGKGTNSSEQPRQILVLGMHRSGTSALTSALVRMGVFVGDQEELTPGNWENPHGFFERRDARRICDALLHSAGADWWKVSKFDPSHVGFPVLGEERKAIINLAEKLDAHGHWALKEPRLCVLMPIFQPVLPRALAVVALRHPVEIAMSLHHRNGFPIQAGLALWEAYIVRALTDSRELDRCFVHYDALLRNPHDTLGQLAVRLEKLGVTGLDPERGAQAIDPSLFRERQGGAQDWRLSPEQARLWAMLCSAPLDGTGLGTVAHSPHVGEILREFESDFATRQALITEKGIGERERRKTDLNLQQARTSLEETGAKLNSVNEQLEVARSELNATKTDLAATRAELSATKTDLAATRVELAHGKDAARAELSATKTDLAATRVELAHSHKALSDMDERLEKAQQSQDGREAAYGRLSRDMARASAANEALKGELTAQRRLAERLVRAHQDALRRGMEHSAAEIRSFGKARHKAGQHIANLEWTLRLTAREKAVLSAELVGKGELVDSILNSRSWRILARARRLGRNSVSAALRRRALVRSAPMSAVSSVFDAGWYSERYSDVILSGLNPIEHYLARGAGKGRDPGPLFSVEFYLNAAEGIGQRDEANHNPLEHYLTKGALAGLSPHPLFDAAFYFAENPDVMESGMNPLVHFLTHGGQEGRSPCAYFDARWYLDTYADVAEAGGNPLLHYLNFGGDEGRDPAPNFSTLGYLKSYPDVLRSLQNPLLHYVVAGRHEGRNPMGLGDVTAPILLAGAPSNVRPAPVPASPAAYVPFLPAQSRTVSPPKLPLNALLISWDVGHNPVGRAYMLAEAVDRVVEHTVIAGFQFPRYGAQVWEPLRQSRLPVIPIPGRNLPDMIHMAQTIADQVRPDIVIACKPRLPSLQLGLHIRDAAGCPLILDIDDHELSFFANRDAIGLEQLKAMESGAWTNHVEPYGEEWTRLAEGMTGLADRILVSNTALQQRFGGELLPHVRDETAFRPVDAASRKAARAIYGVPPDALVVLFFGTPRLHKGVGALAQAVAAIDDPRARLVIVGDAPDRSVTSKLNQIAPGRVIQIPGQPFSAIPTIMALGDVVALPQDIDHPISQYQLPAKAIDAIAAGLPLLVTPTPPLMDLVSAGLAIPFEPERLKDAILEALNAPVTPASRAGARAKFLQNYSYQAASETLRRVIDDAMAQKPAAASMGAGKRLATAQYQAMAVTPPDLDQSISGPGRDIVMFWKQNDSTLYGRRNDMIASYLASREDVRRVIVFDAPVSRNRLVELRDRGHTGDQDRLIYVRTMEKVMGLRDEGKIARRVMVYQPRHVRNKDSNALQDQTIDHIRKTLQREGVDPAQAIFWLYPRNPFLEAIVDVLKPARVVTDIVDDHRAWPNVSDEERKSLDKHYANVLHRADFVMANCEPVRASMSDMRPDIRLIPNGCDTPGAGVMPVSAAFQRMVDWKGKIIGFTGNLEAKIDDGLIERLSRAIPDALIVLVGSTHANPAIRELAKLPNVLMSGVAPYEELGAWVSRFDVAVIPHRRMALTESMNPLKQYVYLSYGVPVVATNISGLEDTPGITVANNSEAFISAVQAALETPQQAGMTQDFIRDHGWATRLSSVVDEILAG